MKTSLKALFVDLDGTLVDSLPFLKKTFKRFLKKYGILPPLQDFQMYNGLCLQTIIQILRKKHSHLPSQDELLKEYQTHLQNSYLTLPLHNGAGLFLEYAYKRGLNLILVTAAPYKLAKCFLKSHNIMHYFQSIQTNDCLKIAKQDPAFYKQVLSKYALAANEVLLIEDSMKNILAANLAGMKSMLIAHRAFFHPLPSHNNFKTLKHLLSLQP